MWTTENRPRYNRDMLRYPSDLTTPPVTRRSCSNNIASLRGSVRVSDGQVDMHPGALRRVTLPAGKPAVEGETTASSVTTEAGGVLAPASPF